MRSSKSRSRNKSNRQRSIGNIINRVFDSSGPEGKVRGTPQQIIEKYLALARDAQLGNDRVAEQNFLQHAEHYTRMLGEAQREIAREQEERQRAYQQPSPNGGRDRFQDRNDRNSNEPRFAGAEGDASFPREGEQDAPMTIPEPFSAEEEDAGLVETPETQAELFTPPVAEDPIAEEAAAPDADETEPAAPRRRPGRRPASTEDAANGAEAAAVRKPRRPRKPRAPKADAASGADAPARQASGDE